MPTKDDTRYDTARSLAETALDAYAKGDTRTGDMLAEQAVRIDRKAVEDVVSDLDEDAEATGQDGSALTRDPN